MASTSNGTKPKGTTFLCPVCGRFLAEFGTFLRVKHCGYEWIGTYLREDLTAVAEAAKIAATK